MVKSKQCLCWGNVMSANLLTEKEYVNIIKEFPKPDCVSIPENYYVNNGTVLYKYNDISYDVYANYCSLLIKAGYSQKKYDHSVYKISAFIKDENLIYTYYLEEKELLRIVFEPYGVLPDDNQLQFGGCELYQLSLDQTEVDCGMSYVIKLCDGSFFIIDGGYFSKGECDRLYKFLCDHSDGEIIISGWFFSHAHRDHFGCFMDFTEKYSKSVKIEKLYYNFPSLYILSSINWKPMDRKSTERFYQVVNQYLFDIPHIKLHTGQSFNVKNICIDVIATHEDLYPNDFENFNDTSTVIRITVNGKSIMFLGDASDEMSDLLIDTYGEKLKTDIVQLAHHGFNGTKKEVYELIDAVTVLWPTADYVFDKNLYRSANTYLFKESKTAREHIIAGYGTRSILL